MVFRERNRTLITKLKSLCTKWKKPRRVPSGPSCLAFSAMEVPTQLRHVFGLIDSNGDGKISPLELGEVLQSLGTDKSEAEGMVREADRDGDGFIDLDEFMHVVGPAMGDEGDLADAFQVFDADRNGVISAEELRRVLVGLGHGRCSVEECRVMIRGVDRNGDGVVDFEEFRAMMAAGNAVF